MNWWEKIIQNQLASIIAIIFMCGGLYAKIGVMGDYIKEVREELKLVRQLDKSNELLNIRIEILEQWKRDVSSRDDIFKTFKESSEGK